ncbi:MAG TPA: S8 family serine peptidase [Mycobacteriales bacterium]|nr:S8 family serine peptidase [Mycobacteriales bacterium]
MRRLSVRMRRSVVSVAVGATCAAGVLVPGGSAVAAQPAADGPLLSYLVVTAPSGHQVHRAEAAVRGIGGTVWVSYGQIGVIVARSTDPNFAVRLRASHAVQLVGASRTVAIPMSAEDPTVVRPATATASAPAGQDPLEPLQWDMRQIHADAAHAVTLGSRRVVVGVLDSGIDATHPDLAGQVDPSLSASCVNGGRVDTSPASWAPTTSGHGTHVAGTIAAARNGVGIVGIAPGVRLAAVKVVDDGGFIYGEYAVCGFVWAAEHHFTLTNNSYFVDPWLFNCPTDPDQAAISVAVRRAIAFARHNGVLNVAAAGNFNNDLAHKTVDTFSPDDQPTPTVRPVTNNCLSLPTEAPGVVTVSAVGAQGIKASYSTYGPGVIEVTAPGGDRFQSPGPGQATGVLSTLPGGRWGTLSGTSMASPHAVGVLALIASTHPHASPGQLTTLLERESDPIACPAVYDINQDGVPDATCVGPARDNGFYGHGLVDAARAVAATHGHGPDHGRALTR